LFDLKQTENYIHVELSQVSTCLSSAVLNGGSVQVKHLLNLKVTQNAIGTNKGPFEAPQTTIQRHADKLQLKGCVVGMMTSASMNSLRVVEHKAQGVHLAVILTAGLSNARCAGDPAEYRKICEEAIIGGTINTFVITDASLTPAALCEAVMIATEAKASCLQELAVFSKVSESLATGTGTDSIAVICGKGSPVPFCGKHTLFGELLAKAVKEALRSSTELKK